ncbi:MAG TPA: hypothetical protein VFW96_16170 [Thermomicrobiales bacterium]|nr:hypothetical protein [Thermomicrobiales bacterium]
MTERISALDALADTLLALDADGFEEDARTVVQALPDGARGLLASVLAGAYGEEDCSFADIAGALGLDSADPSLMSRPDVMRLLGHTRRERPAAFLRALRALRQRPEQIHLIGAAFAPVPDGVAETGAD